MSAITDDFGKGDGVPWFLWDEAITVDELRAVLNGPDGPRKLQLLGKMLREARDIDVWEFTTPAEVRRLLPLIERRVGRRLPFWRFLIDGWVADGLLA
jgi:hypothetical protein